MNLNRIASVSSIRTLNVLLNQKCNFSCSYCYSAMGRNGEELNSDVLCRVLDWFISSQRGERLNVVFSGGGDPVLSFPILRDAVSFIRRCGLERRVQTDISIVTNGSRLSDEIIDFLLCEDIELVVSFDILQDVQDKQRSQYQVVSDTLRHLVDRKLCPGIRSTITPLNVERLVEMVDELHNNFTKLSSVAFEAVLDNKLFTDINELRCFYDTFVERYFQAKQHGLEIGVNVGNTIDNSIQEYCERACPGKLVLTSDGSFTACSRISSKGDMYYEYFKFGYADKDGLHIDEKKYSTLMDSARLWADDGGMSDDGECTSCSAKWHCGGGCLLARKHNDKERMAEFCRFTRMMVERSYRFKLEHSGKVRHPEDYPLLTVLPNNICNFSCPYCYAATGRNGARLDSDKLLCMIDWFFDKKDDGFNKPLTISYMGGGEPMLSWDEVRHAIEYAQLKASQRSFKLNQRIITNGSLLSDEQIVFIAQHRVAVSVSFEILEDVQTAQRGQYAKVRRNIYRLINSGVGVEINSTITPMNVDRMEEMVLTLIKEYPEVRSAMFEPVTEESLFATPGVLGNFYDCYIQQFIKAFKIGRENGLDIISFAYLRSVYPLDRACAGELCITADGNLTGCYCMSSPKDRLFSQTHYGHVTQKGEVFIDMETYRRLMDVNVYSKPQCADCPAKWHCGGGCFHQMESYSPLFREEVCRFTRKFLERIICEID